MGTAYYCDRCGEYIDPVAKTTMTIGRHNIEYNRTTPIATRDFCKKCTEEVTTHFVKINGDNIDR